MSVFWDALLKSDRLRLGVVLRLVMDRRVLDEAETQDVLHRMAFELQGYVGVNTRSHTAIKAATVALLSLLVSLMKAEEDGPPSKEEHKGK